MSKRKPPARPANHKSQSRQASRPAAPATKREKFEAAGRFPLAKVAIIGAVVVVVAVAAVVSVVMYNNGKEAGGAIVAQDGTDYTGGNVEMAALSSSRTTGDSVTLSAAELTTKKIGGIVYSRSTPMPASFDLLEGNGLPLLAYVSPSGRLVVATAMCEPCRSYEFHIEGNELVCNVCLTRWDLNTLEGVSGGCLDYPPKELNTIVRGDTIQIPASELEAWTPRV